MDEIVIKNKTIIDFYNQYDTLNIEEVNLWIISMFEKIKNNVTGKIDNSLLNDILNKIQQTSTNTEIAMNHIENMKEVHKLSNDKYSSEMGNIQIILKQVMDSVTHHNLNLKTDISNSISTILKNNINNGVSDEVIKSLNGTLESQLNSYLDKTKIFYMENLPNIISTNNEPIVKH
jgi:6-pyruvoyl-tetrahydropterin synthase